MTPAQIEKAAEDYVESLRKDENFVSTEMYRDVRIKAVIHGFNLSLEKIRELEKKSENALKDCDEYCEAWEKAKDQITALETQNKELVEALEDANEFTSSILEDMQHYFENKCIPTVDEVNACSIADSLLRIIIAKYKSKLKAAKDE
jgi:hypothetical protein